MDSRQTSWRGVKAKCGRKIDLQVNMRLIDRWIYRDTEPDSNPVIWELANPRRRVSAALRYAVVANS